MKWTKEMPLSGFVYLQFSRDWLIQLDGLSAPPFM